MATKFLQVDLSENGRDFEQVALEPGVPILDPGNVNYRVLRKWLGRLIAEPEWQGRVMSLFVCDEQGARPHNVCCEPAPARDIQHSATLKQDFEELDKRLRQVKPVAKEARLHAAVVEQFRKLVHEPRPRNFECHFFKYQDGAVWRLVWAWGFQRKDVQPAPPTICTNPNCRLLFVRREDGGRTCPACEKGQTGARAPRKSRTGAWVAVALIALLAAGAGYFGRDFFKQSVESPTTSSSETASGLVAAPAEWTGPAGARFAFKVVRRDGKGGEEDVSANVIAVAENPKIVRFDDSRVTAQTRTQGRTAVHFYLGGQEAHATVDVQSPVNPAQLALAPSELTLGVGTTARLRLIGRSDDGAEIDLTDRAEWDPVSGAILTCAEGRVEGLFAGNATIVARYRATADAPYLTAESRVKVVEEPYSNLDVAVAPSTITVGKSATVTATVTNGSGEKRSVLGSSRLTLEVDAVGVAAVEGDQLRGLTPGTGKLTAKFGQLTAQREFRVEADPDGQFVVTPKELHLVVGETASLQIATTSNDPIQVTSAAPQIAAVSPDFQVVGRAAGKTELTIRQEAREATVLVEVAARALESIAFVPARISVAVDGTTPVRVVGRTPDQQEIDLAPETITWEQLPAATSAHLNVRTLQLTGRQATGDLPIAMTARVGDKRASAQIDVVQPAAPALELAPANPLALRSGQVGRLTAWARYGDGRRVEVPASRLQWRLDPADSAAVTLDGSTGDVRPAGATPASVLVSAEYQGARSNAVEVRVVSGALTIALRADRDAIRTGDSGRLVATADGESVDNVSLDGLQFTSSAPDVFAVDPTTGAYRALSVGQATVTAAHPNAASPATLLVEVAVGEAVARKPVRVRIISALPEPIVIPVRSRFTEFKVEASFADGTTEDATRDAVYRVESELTPPPAVATASGIAGQSAGAALVHAAYRGIDADKPLAIEVRDGPLVVDELVVTPARFELATGEQLALRVEGFVGSGEQRRSLGDVTNRPELGWQSDKPEIARADGPNITALAPGDATLTVTAGKATGSAQVHVGPVSDEPVLQPEALRMKAGESRWLGRDIRVTRGGVDFSEQAELVSANEAIVRVNSRNGSVQAVSVGRALVAVSALGKSFTLPVEVVPADGAPGAGTVVIEPAAGSLAVGETLGLRVLVIDDAGQRLDRTASAVLKSSDPDVLGLTGNRATGVKPGEATVTALLPGFTEPGRAAFAVVDDEITRLSVSPAPLKLSVGQRRLLHVTAEGPRGRRELSASHPDLKMSLEGDQPTALEFLGAGEVRGALPGKARLRVEWRGIEAPLVSVEVTLDPDAQLRIEPPDATIEAGQRATFLVFARQGDRERPVTAADGLQLIVSDPHLAEVGRDLTVLGKNAGATEVVARLGTERAAAPLTIVPSNTGVPPMRPGLHFIPDVLTLQLGVPAASVRLVRVWPGGRTEDVDHKAEFTVSDENVVELKRTDADANRPVFLGKSLGDASVHGRLGGLTTSSPMLVHVVDAPQEPPRLDAAPNPFTLLVEQADDFRSVRIIPGGGGPPLNVDYTVESADSQIAVIEGGKRIRGVAPGVTRVTVRPANVPSHLAALAAEIAVQVRPAPNEARLEPLGANDPGLAHLELTGPEQTTVGAEIQFRVNLTNGAQSRDVTTDGAELILENQQQGMATVKPGCALTPQEAGTLRVRARYRDLESNGLNVYVNPLATDFQSIELEMDDRPMSADGEMRSYKVWGTPKGGGPRQDLTSRVQSPGGTPKRGAPVVLLAAKSPSGADMVTHRPPTVTARAPGVFRMQAGLPETDVKSEIVEVDVVPGGGSPLVDLTAVPAKITVRIGERLPPIRAVAQPVRGEPRPVDVTWASRDESVVGPDPADPGVLWAKSVGATTLHTTHGGRSVSVPVTVVGNLFGTVTLNEEADVKPGNRFAVTINVEANVDSGSKVEYRVVAAGHADDSNSAQWRELPAGAAPQRLSLISPDILVGPPNTTYSLRIEARQAGQKSVDKYFLRFRLSNRIQQQSQPNASVTPVNE